MARALGEYDVRGIKTTIPFFRWLLADPDFQAGRFDTTFIDRRWPRGTGGRSSRCRRRPSDIAAVAAALQVFTRKRGAPAGPAVVREPLAARLARTEGLR